MPLLLGDRNSNPLTRDPVQQVCEFDENITEVGAQTHDSWEVLV